MTLPGLPLIHPGEQLREEFMRPFGLSVHHLAQDIDLPAGQVQALIEQTEAVTGDIALRLARYFGTTPEFWLNLQRDYDLARALIDSGDKILSTISPRAM
ncbi:MAG TPA: HigA family addiction module antitoxin [Magnetospirillaceae bacterium]|nr:HigA family addiction module antitoxin [Magnetospirillaceae bacterium]